MWWPEPCFKPSSRQPRCCARLSRTQQRRNEIRILERLEACCKRLANLHRPPYMRNLGRDVAQPGSASHWGCGGRRFESSRPDQFFKDLATLPRLGLRFSPGFSPGIFLQIFWMPCSFAVISLAKTRLPEQSAFPPCDRVVCTSQRRSEYICEYHRCSIVYHLPAARSAQPRYRDCQHERLSWILDALCSLPSEGRGHKFEFCRVHHLFCHFLGWSYL